jgi:hypothetical protein
MIKGQPKANTTSGFGASPGGLWGAGIVLLAVLATTPTASVAASRIAIVAKVQNQVGAVLGADTRTLSLGNDVFVGDRVHTGNLGSAQLMFLDQTNLTIGQASDIALDRFVYDPVHGARDIALSATKGELRFISRGENPSTYRVDTPLATIDIRGTLAYLIFFGSTQYIVNIRGQIRAALNYPGDDTTPPAYFATASPVVTPNAIVAPSPIGSSHRIVIEIPQGSALVLVPEDRILAESRIIYSLNSWDVAKADFYGLAEVPLFPELPDSATDLNNAN